jgi:GNAT superfamily N-acetyltransferase
MGGRSFGVSEPQDDTDPKMPLTIRTATLDDLPHIERVMQASMRDLGARFYDRAQTESAVRFIAVADPQIVADGTYFVVEEEGVVVACGGWSRRKKLFTGTARQAAVEGFLDPRTEPARIRAMFVDPAHARRGIGRMILARAETDAAGSGFTRCELMATLPGVPLYAACGYQPLERAEIELPDGVRLECLHMSRCVK